MTSKETSKKYIEEFQSTEIQRRETINDDDSLIFNMNFVGNPFFEIKGNNDRKFEVSFFNSNNQLTYKTTLSTNMWSRLNTTYFQEWKIMVESDNFKKMFVYNCKNKRVYISLDSSSLGDTIAWVPYAEEFRKKWGCHVIISTFWNKLFKNSYPNLEFVEPGTIVHNLYAMYVLGWFWNKDKEPEEPNTIPLQKSASNILGLDFKEIKPEIDFTPKENPYKQKYVVIAPHSTSGLKYWNNPTGWQETIDYLNKQGYKVINISKDPVEYKNVENIKDTSIENTMNLIHHSEFMIGLSSGLSWLSWGLNKHVVMISNFTTEDHEFQSNCTRIINKSVCNGCWNKTEYRFDKGDWHWCPIFKGTDRHFECHKSITSKTVINRIKNIEKLSKFEWGWMSDNLNQKNILIKEIFEDRIYERVFEVEEGDVVLDIGSSVGPFIFSSSEKIKHAYCLEPSDVEFDTLLKNMENIPSTCLKKGISNKTGKIESEHVYGGQEEMDSISFKDLIKEYSIEKIDFLKTDCEGGEYDIFTEDNIEWIKNNVRKISGEWHLSNYKLKEKFRNFRDKILPNFTNFEVYSIDGVNIKWDLYNEHFIEYYSEVLFYIKNEDDYEKHRLVKKNNTFFKVYESERWSKNFWENRFNTWEEDTFIFLDKFLDKNKTVIDIGGWIGPISLYSSFHSKNCISFEPDPIAYGEFTKNIKINNIKNIFLEKKGVSIFNNIEIGASELGHSVTRVGVSENSFDIECITISEILKKYDLNDKNISLIKIDIEGHESDLLKDKNLIDLEVPMIISFHPGFSSDKEEFYESVKPFLIKKGYNINNYPHSEDFFDIIIE